MTDNSDLSKGFIYRRYRRKMNSQELLDAHDYGYHAWKIPIRK